MEQSYNLWANQEIISFLLRLTTLTLSHMNQIHSLSPYLCDVRSGITHPCLPSCLFLSTFSTKALYIISFNMQIVFIAQQVHWAKCVILRWSI